jgi:hypothetical protein
MPRAQPAEIRWLRRGRYPIVLSYDTTRANAQGRRPDGIQWPGKRHSDGALDVAREPGGTFDSLAGVGNAVDSVEGGHDMHPTATSTGSRGTRRWDDYLDRPTAAVVATAGLVRASFVAIVTGFAHVRTGASLAD